MSMKKSVRTLALISISVFGVAATAQVWSGKGTEQANPVRRQLPSADESYDSSIKNPTYTKNHPRVLFDEAHQNLHRTDGLYRPFVSLISNDGYRVTANRQEFSTRTLANYQILIIANARAFGGNESAFSNAECQMVADWVRSGGALLLIADHAPLGGFAAKLSLQFGVEMSNSYTDDPYNRDKELEDLLFSRDNALLVDHPITNGQSGTTKVNRVVSFTGQSLSIPANGQAVLRLSETAIDTFPNTARADVPARGRAQMVAMKFGKGRVVVSGEAAMFSAQIMPDGFKFGLNASQRIDNRQLVLNMMHWLSGVLE